MKKHVLFVDDESNALDALRRTLRDQRQAWEMRFAGSVDEALALLHTTAFDAVISDVSMPGKDGFYLLAYIRDTKRYADLPILMLTGKYEVGLKRRALDLGATDLLNKPADKEDLVASINSLLRLKSYQDQIKTQNSLLEQKVKERTEELEASRLDLIWRLGKAAEYRDTDTGNHVVRVAYYCKALAEKMCMERRFAEMIFLTSPLHDIGKIGIPDNILLKRGKLTPTEWAVMQKHCSIGADILQQDSMHSGIFQPYEDRFVQPLSVKSENPLLKMAATIASTHHEHWDGNGYPFGIAGDDIPLESRIVAVADVYDALLATRPYKIGFPEEKALAIMRESNGLQFDPTVFASFEESLAVFKEIRIQFMDESNV